MNVVFVCQKGELEIKSLLLAWSLRNTHGENIRLIAALPKYKDWQEISDATTSLFAALGVELRYFIPVFGDEYPIGNKISALALLPQNEMGCFLDSDMLSLSKWSVADALQNRDSAAKPADLGTWGTEDGWQKIYQLLNVPTPVRRVRLTVNNVLSYPYFNAGFIVTNKPEVLSDHWQEIAKKLDEKELGLENKYPWLDQIALPVAMEKTGDWALVSEFYNYPAHLRSLGDIDIGMVHYHTPGVILREPRLRGLFQKAISEHPDFLNIISANPQWSVLINKRTPSLEYKKKERNFIITGIPRSGTSYLTSVLDSQAEWLVLNEPREIFNHLQSRTDASGIDLYYAECRERILSGQPILNKIKDGKVIEDTAIIDQQVSYHPEISRSDFWLGSKNTLAYIASMEYLIKLNWPIVAMIRNPLDTLASWRNTFSHLAEAKVANLPIANPDFLGWSTWQRQSLLEIDLQSNAALRRVLLWRLLARTLLHYQSHLLLWRYEDLMDNPAQFINKLNTQLKYDGGIGAIATRSRKRANDYNNEERDMLIDLCAAELTEFKYII